MRPKHPGTASPSSRPPPRPGTRGRASVRLCGAFTVRQVARGSPTCFSWISPSNAARERARQKEEKQGTRDYTLAEMKGQTLDAANSSSHFFRKLL
jgi:hypothetical protein